MSAPDDNETLEAQALAFALELTETVRHVAGADTPAFAAVAARPRRGQSKFVGRQGDDEGITLKVMTRPMLKLLVEMRCTWDHREKYLAVDSSKIEVVALGGQREPLFRYEYLRKTTSGVPSAHVQIHAHRDAFTYLMVAAGTGSARSRGRYQAIDAGRLPQLSDLHFPVGGPRFRPCLEDVLEMLLDEFGVDQPPDASRKLAEGRADWRRKQLGAAVRDSPETAARVLGELGYEVRAPAAGPAPDRRERLAEY